VVFSPACSCGREGNDEMTRSLVEVGRRRIHAVLPVVAEVE
jgi:hypothetical protein